MFSRSAALCMYVLTVVRDREVWSTRDRRSHSPRPGPSHRPPGMAWINRAKLLAAVAYGFGVSSATPLTRTACHSTTWSPGRPRARINGGWSRLLRRGGMCQNANHFGFRSRRRHRPTRPSVLSEWEHIAGANRGIGRAVAVRIPEMGHRVVGAFLPAVLARRWGRVVMVSSENGTIRGLQPAASGYLTSKAAFNAMTVLPAGQLAGSGVLINAVSPGRARTRMLPTGKRTAEEAAAAVVDIATPSRHRTQRDIGSRWSTHRLVIGLQTTEPAALPGVRPAPTRTCFISRFYELATIRSICGAAMLYWR